MTPAPILLFVYRRPDHARQVLEALRRSPEAASSELFIYSDGPKTPEVGPSVEAVRELCRNIQGFAKVTLVERSTNWGLAKSIIAGVTEVCAAKGRVIVLEDDIVVSPHFLAYMNEALDRYAADEGVMQISGHLFQVPWTAPQDAAFLPLTDCLGWATWQRAWSKFDSEMRGYPQLIADRRLRKAFDLDGSFPFFRMLKEQQKGKVDSWAVRFYLYVFINKGRVLFPAKSLVHNIGFDGTGTNGVPTGTNTWIDESFVVRTYPPVSAQNDSRIYHAITRYLRSKRIGRLAKLMGTPAKLGRIIPWLRQRRFMRNVRSQAIVGQSSEFYPPARVINLLHEPDAIQIGENSHIRGDLVVFAHGGRIQMGDFCFLGEGSRVWSARSVEIGNRVLIAHGVTIMDNISHPTGARSRHEHFKAIITTGHPTQIDLNERPVVIQDDAWIGCMSVILPGVTIGRGAIVGAGSVVTTDIPPWAVAVGNPAKKIRDLPNESEPETTTWADALGRI